MTPESPASKKPGKSLAALFSRKSLKEAFSKKSVKKAAKTVKEISLDTLRDLHKPKEILFLLGTIVTLPVPFCPTLTLYVAYRVGAYYTKKAANDNTPPGAARPNQKPVSKSGPAAPTP